MSAPAGVPAAAEGRAAEGRPAEGRPAEGRPAGGAAVADLVVRLADDDLLTGHVLTSLAGWGPELEINIALSSMGQDEIGHARRLYALVASAAEAERMVYERPAPAFRASPLARVYPAQWEMLLARQFLYETADAARAAVLARAGGERGALIAEMAHEERYHLDFWRIWLRTTAARSDAARGRVQGALDAVWPLAEASFLPERPGEVEASLGLGEGALARAGQEWAAAARGACAELGLSLRGGRPDPALDRLGAMLEEMRSVYQTAPGRW